MSKPMRIIPNQSEKLFVSGLTKNGQKSIRLNQINSETSIGMNPNQSKTKFSIQINPNPSDFGFELKTWFWIHTDCYLRLNRIRSDWFWPFFIKRDAKRFTDWFGMIRIGSDTDIGIVPIDSEWISIRFFLPGLWNVWNNILYYVDP